MSYNVDKPWSVKLESGVCLVLLEAAVLLLTQRGVGVAQYFTHARGGQKVVVTCPGVVDALAEPHDLDLAHGT